MAKLPSHHNLFYIKIKSHVRKDFLFMRRWLDSEMKSNKIKLFF